MESTDLHNVQEKQTTYKELSQIHASEQQKSSGFFCLSHSRYWRNTKGTQTSHLPPADTTDLMHTQCTFTRSVFTFTNNLKIWLNKYINKCFLEIIKFKFFKQWLQIKCGWKLFPLMLKMSHCMTEEKESILQCYRLALKTSLIQSIWQGAFTKLFFKILNSMIFKADQRESSGS